MKSPGFGRHGLGLFLLVLGILPLRAQDATALYAGVSPSIVYLQYGFTMKASLCAKPELWQRYEQLSKRPFLDGIWAVSSGSGFFVDQDGSILTNRHVAKTLRAEVVRYDESNDVARWLEKNYSSSFSSQERADMVKDFRAMIDKADYVLTASANGRELGKAVVLVLAGEGEPDLALVKVEGGPYPALRLAAKGGVGQDLVGKDVLSFGYPLGTMLEELFTERAVTMNRGTVSALRKTEMSIQHSAAISHGNSGGPLLDASGQVIGVNTASLQEVKGNSLYYAIDIDQVQDFIEKHGLIDLARWNRRLPAGGSGPGVKLNALGEFESSPNLIVDADPKSEVFVEGAKVGAGPTMVVLGSPLSRLEVRGPAGGFSTTVRLLAAASGSTILKPVLTPSLQGVAFTSDPPGARVVADGRVLGITPFTARLPEDSYQVSLVLEGQWFAPTTLKVAPNGQASWSFKGEAAYPLRLLNGPREAEALIVCGSAKGESSFPAGSQPALPAGRWDIRVSGSAGFRAESLSVEVGPGGAEVDLAKLWAVAELRIAGLDGRARIFVDGKELTNPGTDSLALPLGRRTVSVWEEGFAPLLPLPITVRPDGKSFVTWDRIAGHKVQAGRARLWSYAVLGGGAAIAGLGYYLGQNSIALASTGSYGEYRMWKGGTASLLAAGVALAASSLIFNSTAAQEERRYEEEQKILSQLEAGK